MVANVAAGILSELGYKTRIATSSSDALEIITAGVDVDLIFSDVVMPDDLNGFEFARAVSKVRPNIRIQLTSGFTKFRGVEADDEISRILAANVLTKPYNRQELAASVRRSLDAPPLSEVLE